MCGGPDPKGLLALAAISLAFAGYAAWMLLLKLVFWVVGV